MPPNFTINKIKRFNSHIRRTATCWEWTSGVDKDGYGRYGYKDHVNNRIVETRAHRLAFYLYKGRIMAGMMLDHLCRNPICVNPSHLEPVTNAENQRRGNAAKLTDKDVMEIREAGDMGIFHRNLAIQYGVNQSTITRIINYKRWRV